MKTTIWQRRKVTIYIGGDPAKKQAPEITLELDSPQIQMDSNTGIVTIIETK